MEPKSISGNKIGSKDILSRSQWVISPDKEVEKMIELLHPDGGRWDIDKMNETFIEADVEDILKIPVGRAETYDYISQNYTKKTFV
jgi:hypothetical protein